MGYRISRQSQFNNMDLESKDGMHNFQLQEPVVLTGTGSSNRFKAKRAGEFGPFRCI